MSDLNAPLREPPGPGHYVALHLPDGRTRYADYRAAIVPVLRRILAVTSALRDPDPVLYEQAAAWLDSYATGQMPLWHEVMP